MGSLDIARSMVWYRNAADPRPRLTPIEVRCNTGQFYGSDAHYSQRMRQESLKRSDQLNGHLTGLQ